jgi:hypothetical protein
MSASIALIPPHRSEDRGRGKQRGVQVCWPSPEAKAEAACLCIAASEPDVDEDVENVIGVVAATPSKTTTVLSRLSPLEFLQAAMALLE